MNDIKPACHTQSILTYVPLYGDYLVWSKWFSTWHGFLIDYRQPSDCTFMIAGLPALLVRTDGIGKSIQKLNLEELRNSRGGRFTIIRHSHEHSLPIWFV
jgi:hypothetical protein